MKKYDLLQLAVLLVGIWSVYQACLFFCYLLITLLHMLTAREQFQGLISFQEGLSYFISDFVIMIGHIIIAWLAFTKTESILTKIRVTERNTGIEIPAAKQLLYIMLVGIGLYLLAQGLPELLDATVALVRSEVDPGSDYPRPVQLSLPVMKVLFPIILLIFGRRIVGLFVK